LYNKKLVGKNYGIFGKGSFPGEGRPGQLPPRSARAPCTPRVRPPLQGAQPRCAAMLGSPPPRPAQRRRC
jgi:hypothetical protein